ncbi:hypothetical protein ERO13_A10G236032v2 [Gossypium hirsutum]|nr:hypothetical protein ERO13_A10G236032v2 [Gossypium hirsutum]
MTGGRNREDSVEKTLVFVASPTLVGTRVGFVTFGSPQIHNHEGARTTIRAACTLVATGRHMGGTAQSR